MGRFVVLCAVGKTAVSLGLNTLLDALATVAQLGSLEHRG